MLLRFLLWRLLGLLAVAGGFALISWLLDGGLGAALRGSSSLSTALNSGAATSAPVDRSLLETGGHAAALPSPDVHTAIPTLQDALGTGASGVWGWGPIIAGVPLTRLLVTLVLALGALIAIARWWARRRRRYVRLCVEAYRTDRTSAEAIVTMFEALHKRLLRRWWRRLLQGQPSVALEVHHTCATDRDSPSVWLAVSCPEGLEGMVQAALRTAYPNCHLSSECRQPGTPPYVLRLKKHAEFIKRVKVLDRFEHEREPPMNRLMTVMGACGSSAFVQLAMTPTPALFERHSKRLYKHHEAHLSRERRDHLQVRDRSMVEDAELRGGLEVQHRPLFFAELRVIAPERRVCEQIASELRVEGAENRLVERGTAVRHSLLGLYGRRVRRGEGNPLPSFHKGVMASTELAALWHLPSIDYGTVPFERAALPLAPAPPTINRPRDGRGTLRDALGAVSIHPELRKQNTAVPGAVDQGKSSYLTATVAEDLRRERCAVIVLDPKGDAAEAAVSLVPAERTCTLLDFSHPTCGFNPLAVDAPADVIADYVVAALKNLFTDADIRASSDRYLRNAIIAVLAHDRSSTLWDAARLLTVGEEGYSYRARVGARVRTLPEFKEISEFFTAELTAQLADSRSMTTAKLDAPVNKLARLLNSSSIKRVLLNESLTIDFDRVISGGEVLVVKGAMGAMGAGNTSVLMQLLVGMLDAALARQQDLVPAEERMAVALKVDEAPLVLNRGFAETLALKRSAGLETVACWQTEAQWVDREVRDQLDALFAHRVYFATASVRDARAAASILMAEFSDTVRPGIEHLSVLGHPDARLHLPKHHAIVSWTTPQGRQPPFIAETIPLHVDQERLALHAARQAERGGRHRADLRQPHWDRKHREAESRETESAQAVSQADTLAAPDRPGRQLGSPEEAHPPVSTPARAEASLPAEPSVPAELPVPVEAPASVEKPAGAEEPRPSVDGPAREQASAEKPVSVPGVPADSYRELVELDDAHSVRWAKRVESPRALEPEILDIEMLALVASLRHVLSSQIHRRFNPKRAATTTQRRLKRLSDAGLVRRFQFHRRDGGGVPMCYAMTAAGLELLHAHGRLEGLHEEDIEMPPGSSSAASPVAGDRLLRQARHDVHAAGWALALEHALDAAPLGLRGPVESVLSPPSRRSSDDGRVALGPGDLILPGGRAAHDFLRTDGTGERVALERFETVRPDLTIELSGRLLERVAAAARAREMGIAEGISAEDIMVTERGAGVGAAASQAGAIDLLIELDDRLLTGRTVGKLERYDHLLAGWSVHTTRYGRRQDALPMVVFVCRDRTRARECAKRADSVLVACRAYAGEYPVDWEYPGRERTLFVAERDAHEGLLRAYGIPRLPPEVRVSAAHGDPRAGEAVAEPREMLAAFPTQAGE